MATEKVTTMVLNVDLQCPCCYKKVKKTLCKYPQIRDQIYNEKANTVTITVVSCCPEKIRGKLCYKGGKTIKSIAIKEAPKPKEADKKKGDEKPKQQEKPKESEKSKEQPKDPAKPKEAEKSKANGKADKPKGDGKAAGEKPAEKPKEAPKPDGPKAPEPAAKPPQQLAKGPEPVPVGVPSVFPYVGPSYDSYATGPYYHGYGVPPPPQPCYEGYYGYGQGYGRGYYMSRPDGYFSEESPQGCSIM